MVILIGRTRPPPPPPPLLCSVGPTPAQNTGGPLPDNACENDDDHGMGGLSRLESLDWYHGDTRGNIESKQG